MHEDDQGPRKSSRNSKPKRSYADIENGADLKFGSDDDDFQPVRPKAPKEKAPKSKRPAKERAEDRILQKAIEQSLPRTKREIVDVVDTSPVAFRHEPMDDLESARVLVQFKEEVKLADSMSTEQPKTLSGAMPSQYPEANQSTSSTVKVSSTAAPCVDSEEEEHIPSQSSHDEEDDDDDFDPDGDVDDNFKSKGKKEAKRKANTGKAKSELQNRKKSPPQPKGSIQHESANSFSKQSSKVGALRNESEDAPTAPRASSKKTTSRDSKGSSTDSLSRFEPKSCSTSSSKTTCTAKTVNQISKPQTTNPLCYVSGAVKIPAGFSSPVIRVGLSRNGFIKPLHPRNT